MNHKDKIGRAAPIIAQDVYEIIMQNIDLIQSKLVYSRDFNYDFFGFKTLEKSYLIKLDHKTVERP